MTFYITWKQKQSVFKEKVYFFQLCLINIENINFNRFIWGFITGYYSNNELFPCFNINNFYIFDNA